MSNTLMDFMNMSPGNFPAMFNGSGPLERLSGGQKVICTPEVSLYTYNGNGPSTVPSPPSPISIDDKGGGNGDLEDPLLAHHSASGFQCGVCGKIFQQKNTFQNHLRSHREGEDPYQCDICGKTFAVPARLTRHYRTHTGEKPYQCEYCNKSFSVKENLSVHRRIHTKERPYKCEVCERAFEHSGKLHRHMRIHTGERPHRCQICQKTFIQSGQLVIHLRTHTGEKPYVCKVCSKGFTCSKQLKVHSRTHTGEKPYSCDICGKSFGYNHVLKLHQVAHYGEKVYKCTICNSTFNSKKSLESHIKTHSSSEPMSPTSLSPPPLLESLSPPRSHNSDSRISSSPSNSSNSHGAPQQHSDKENRESSDSEVSSQNSPTALESPPRSPSSPKIYTPARSSGVNVKSNGSHYSPSLHGSGTTHGSLPYPMLPPGVQIHQPPHSRTTFLYVTSKLPPEVNTTPSNGLSNGQGGNNPEQNFQNERSGQGHIQVKTSSTTPRHTTDVARDKFLRQSASIRDKVLASIEMFGYGLNPGDSSSSSSSSSTSTDLTSSRSKGIQITPVGSDSGNFGFGRGKYSDTTINRNTMSGAMVRDGNVSITPIPENLTNYNAQLSSRVRESRESRESRDSRKFEDQQYNPYSYPSSYPGSKVKGRSSPDLPLTLGSGLNGYSFGSGGVLALALTRGSKAVNQLPFSTPIRTRKLIGPPNATPQTPPLSNPESPDLCLDFSRRSCSVSPTRNTCSLSPPSTTGRSTPGLNEVSGDLVDLSEDNQHHSLLTTKEGLEIIGLGKRTMSNGSNYGARKRSSLILEKYAQENTGNSSPKSPQMSSEQPESILSQRLRQSSVIQYAERCT